MEKLKWHTEKRIINQLIPYENNPRIMTEKQKADLQKSLEEFDLVEIPAIDTDNKIIAGHQRLKIMQLLGRGNEEIDVRVPNRKLTEDEFKRYNLRSNKNVGSWNWDLLANFDEELLIDVGFSEVELSGFASNYGTDFELPDGDKSPFQQMTFTLADEQAEIIKKNLSIAKKDIEIDTFGNENTNGNALYRIVKEWEQQRI